MKFSQCLSAIVSVALLSASPAALAGYTCSGVVRGVAIESNGDVFAESIGAVSWPRLCNVRTNMNGITFEACKAMQASLFVAQASGKTITLWVNDPATTCATLVPWQFVNGLYFLRVDG